MSMAASLIVNSACSDPELPSDKHQVISENWGALTDPLADVIALRLWCGKARVEQMAREILEPTRLSGEQVVPAFTYSWTRNVRKILDALQALRYVDGDGDEYELTDAGRVIFKEVVEHEADISRYDCGAAFMALVIAVWDRLLFRRSWHLE
jgi:hypothetical protein